METLIKLVVLNFVVFMHYVATGLVFFVPIDVAHYWLEMPEAPAIVIGAGFLWLWSLITAIVILKKSS